MPTMAEVRAAIPAECFERRISTSLRYAAMSVALTGGAAVLAWNVLPLDWVWLPMWALYAVVCGTFATGVWVVAHECGHGAFCDNKRVQNTIGFVLHSALLVPYFSWQRSHSIHHAKTNHVTQGETHVPVRANTRAGARALGSQARLGPTIHGSLTLLSRLLFGWPVYLLAGMTGGATKGVTNHFWPWTPFSRSLFPARLTLKVLLSTAGVLVTIALLASWAIAAGSIVPILALFVGPWLVVNAWVVSYTWLHHTDVEIPHYDESEWSFVRGAWCSVDRPYGRSLDFLHHHIGSTHAAHHLFPRLPHYHAAAATRALAESFPELYRYDPTPVPVALWRISKSCVAVTPSTNGWRFVDKQPA